MRLIRKRRRGTALVDTPSGILVVSEDEKTYNLPGGAATNGESWKEAALRELEEETSLRAERCTYLFDFRGRIQPDIKGGFFIDAHKVYLVEASGVAQPRSEIKNLAYINYPNPSLSYATKRIVEKYLKQKATVNQAKYCNAKTALCRKGET